MLATATNPHGTITQADVQLLEDKRPAQFTDQGALKLVVQDASTAEQWLEQKSWSLMWRESDILYQSPRFASAWDNSNVNRANVSRFTVAKHVNALVPTMMSGIFYDSPPFILRPRPGTTQQTCRAKTVLFSALLDDIDFKTECERAMECQTLNGTTIAKWGWVKETTIRKRYVRKNSPPRVNLPLSGEMKIATAESDEFEVEEKEVVKNRPFFEFCELGTVFVDPKWRHSNQIWKAKYVIHRQYLTFSDLDKLRQNPSYNIPSREEMTRWLFPAVIAQSPSTLEQQQQANPTIHHAEGRDKESTADPYEQPLKVDERWDKGRVMTVIQDKIIIRNEEHELGCIPFLSANWWNIQGAGYGMGVGRLIGTDQRVEQGSMNAALDILSSAVNQQYVRSRGANVPTQQIRQRLNGIIDVDGDVDKAFKILETPKVPAEVWTAIQVSKQASESTTGADEAFQQGSIPGRGSSIVRTATGAGGVMAASASRIQGPVGRFVDNIFIPFLRKLDEMVNERMPMEEIREILSDEMPDDFVLDEEGFLNATMRYEVLAGAHLAAKKAMSQSLPLIIQIFENPHMLESLNATGWTVDLKELFDMMMEMSEWKNSRQVVRKMNKQELDAYQATKNPMAGKLGMDIQKMQAQHGFKAQEIDQKTEAQMASKLLTGAADRATGYVERVALEHALEPRALGTPDASYNTTAQ